jgi:large subunit ribosomal protein L20
MVRVKRGKVGHRRHKKVLNAAKGFRGSRSKSYRAAKETLLRAGAFAYRDRKKRKRDFRQLWIIRINAAARGKGLSYSRFMDGLNKVGVKLNRKMISELAIADSSAFDALVEKAEAALKK